MSVIERLAAAGIDLPVAPAPAGAYVPATRSGDMVFTAGQLPLVGGQLLATGLVGEDVSVEAARECARVCAVNALSAAATVCDLDSVVRVLKMTVYVASAHGFTEQPAVADGASELLAVAFADAAPHAREAVGVARLPKDAAVEVSLVIAVG